MVLVKVVKNKAYFKRFQVKFRRRRDCLTNYARRRKLVTQYNDKYGAPKHRLVVRITNKYVICQIVVCKLNGDHVVCSAYSHELPRYGVNFGLSNFSAAYCTGLLLARRVLAKYGLDTLYVGNTDPEKIGDDYNVAHVNGENRPLKVFLDIGLATSVRGVKVFAALKGALDGGLEIPHGTKKFAKDFRDRILGKHVADYAAMLKNTDSEKFAKQFSKLSTQVTPETMAEVYLRCHQKIREDPSPAKKSEETPKKSVEVKISKLTGSQRKANAKERKTELGNLFSIQEAV